MLHWIVQNILRFLIFCLTRLEASGTENLPASGACMIVTNHLSILDGPIIYCFIKRQDFSVLVATKHKANPLFRFIVKSANGIYIDRFLLEVKPLKEINAFLKKGGMIGIAPEGTRSKSYELNQAKEGVAYLASKNPEVQIVPLAVWGTEGAIPKVFSLQRPIIHLRVGAPFTLQPVERQDRHAILERNTEEIMCRIAAMLPEKYRGFYADHTRVKELTGEIAA
jgi:1-acyl-sn-glycerol-3-phosphate acyltransferase